MRKAVTLLILLALLTACDPFPVVEVHFAQPFPSGVADLSAWPGHDRGRYLALTDTSYQLVVGPDALGSLRANKWRLSRAEFDSLRQAQQLFHAGTAYLTEAAGADSVWLRWRECDTLVSLRRPAGAHLRRYWGRYYFSRPASDDSTAWEVRRLTLSKGHFAWERFNPDSLRLRALAPNTVRLRRQAGRLFFTLNPADKKATRQVHDYAGLWLPE